MLDTPTQSLQPPIGIVVATQYIHEQSDPNNRRYVYSYTITIKNLSDRRVQLLSRHWLITDSNAKVQEVQGEGVVGQQPSLMPGQQFEYTSGCVLETPLGVMQGSYTFIDENHHSFKAPIAPFTLKVPGVVH